MHQVSKIYFVTKLYKFRASSVPIIRSYQLYTWQLVCFMQVMWPQLVGYLYEVDKWDVSIWLLQYGTAHVQINLTHDNDCCDRLLVTSASICAGVHQNGCRCLSIFRDTSRYASSDAQFCLQMGRQASKSITPKPAQFNTLWCLLHRWCRLEAWSTDRKDVLSSDKKWTEFLTPK